MNRKLLVIVAVVVAMAALAGCQVVEFANTAEAVVFAKIANEDELQLKGKGPDGGIDPSRSLSNSNSSNEKPETSGFSQAAPVCSDLVYKDGYLPMCYVSPGCPNGKSGDGECFEAYQVHNGICRVNQFLSTALASGWSRDISICSADDGTSETFGPVVGTESFNYSTNISNCLDETTLIVTVGKDLKLVEIFTGEKTLLTKDLTGDFTQGVFENTVCPHILAKSFLPGQLNPDLAELTITAGKPEVARWTLTSSYSESQPEYSDVGAYHTRGILTQDVYYQQSKGAEFELIVPGGSNANFSTLPDGIGVLAYEIDGVIYKYVNGVHSKIGEGINPVVHPISGDVYFYNTQNGRYTFSGGAYFPAATTDVAFTSDGLYVVALINAEAWLFELTNVGGTLILEENPKQLTSIMVEGPVSYPDIYTAPLK